MEFPVNDVRRCGGEKLPDKLRRCDEENPASGFVYRCHISETLKVFLDINPDREFPHFRNGKVLILAA